MKRIISNRKLTLVLALSVITVLAVSAYAAVVSVLLAQGTIPPSEPLNGGAEVRMTQITLQPGDTIPWHYHSGKTSVIIKSGTVTEDEGCGGSEVFTAGQAFEEPIPRVHQVRNTGSVPAELFVAFVTPAGQPRTVNTGGPLCGPPENEDQCKDGGWLNFNFPRSFEDQGDCVSYTNNGR